MLEPGSLFLLLLAIFLLDHILIVAINPATLTNAPGADDSMDLVDRFAGRSIAIFALVLVIIQFIFQEGDTGYYDKLALTTLTIAAGFLMIAFVLELIGDLKVIFFRIQLNSLRYAGLLLFLSLYFLFRTYSVTELYANIFGVFVLVSWMIWAGHDLHYIFWTKRRDWGYWGVSRRVWWKNRFEEHWQQ